MSYKIELDKKANIFLKKLEKGNKKDRNKILFFINSTLSNAENPCLLPNAKHLKGFNDNRYRWRLGDYRIIGKIENNEFKIIQIIRISKKDDNTYKGL